MKNTRKNFVSILVLTFTILIAAAVSTQAASISKKSLTLTTGQSKTLKIKNTKKSVSWKSSSKSVATVSKKGKVRAISEGTATITASVGNKSYTCKVTVRDKNTSGSAKVSGKTAGLSNSTAGMSASEARVYKTLLKYRSSYPEGKKWTNDNYYAWNGGIYRGGYGCAGFAFLLSDKAFGSNEARIHHRVSDIRPGDVLRVDNNTHSVIVLRADNSGVVVAEGNFNRSIHWGRTISAKTLSKTVDYVITRYED